MTADSSWLQFRELRFRVSQLAGYRTEFTQRWDICASGDLQDDFEVQDDFEQDRVRTREAYHVFLAKREAR